MQLLRSLYLEIRGNLKRARLNLSEISGSFGDMGTFLPLLVGMVENNGLPLISSLFFAGFFNFLTGLLYPIPMAVQPMKAIAAIALTENLTPDEIVSAGLITGLVVLVLGLTRGIRLVHKVVPKAVVRGLQLGIGLILARKGLLLAFSQGLKSPMGIFVVVALILVIVNLRFPLPSALIIFLGGMIIELFIHPELIEKLSFSPSLPQFAFPQIASFSKGAEVAISQIPLTTLNSVISVVILSRDLFPSLFREGKRPVTTVKVSVTVGVMNLVGSIFGAMPVCHGSGGLAGQYRFGARTNGSIIFLGFLKMGVALLFGAPLLLFIKNYPGELLGVLLLVAGVELALAGRRVERDLDFSFVLLTAVGIIAKGTLFGVVLGTLAYWLYKMLEVFGGRDGDDR